MLIGERPRRALAWAGIATFAVLSVLGFAHLAGDLVEVVRARGAGIGLFASLGPPALLGLASIGVLVIVVHLAGGDGRRRAVAIAIAFLVLVAVRLVVAAWYDGVADGEPREYEELAGGVLAGACCMADRPMGYAILLALAYLPGFDHQVATEALNIVASIVAGAAVLGLGQRLFGWRVGVAALVAYAVWPAGALMTTVRLPHTTYDAFVVGAAWLAIALPAGWRGSALLGAILGLAQYLRPSTVALVPAFALARLWPGGPWRRIAGGTLLPVAATFLLVLVPAIWHNLVAYGELSPSTSTYGGHILYMGTDIRSGGRFDATARAELEAIVGGEEPRALSEAGARIALERIRSDPVGIALLAIRKQDTLWASERYGVEYAIGRGLEDRPANPRAATPLILSQAFIVLVFVATTAGLALRRRDLDALSTLAITLVWTVSIVHTLLEVRDRYHAYVIPILLPIAGVAAVALIDAVGSRLAGRRRGAVARPEGDGLAGPEPGPG